MKLIAYSYCNQYGVPVVKTPIFASFCDFANDCIKCMHIYFLFNDGVLSMSKKICSHV